MDIDIVKLEKKNDQRGYLIQYLINSELSNQELGTIYIVFINPKMVRACHFHKRKEEWLGIIYGNCKVVLEDVITNEKREFILNSSDDKLTKIRIGPFIAHGLKNLLNDISIVIGYANEAYNPEDPDTYYYELEL